jgi:hypothetical protein
MSRGPHSLLPATARASVEPRDPKIDRLTLPYRIMLYRIIRLRTP